MTVAELIAELLKYEPDASVWVSRGKFNSHLAVIDTAKWQPIGPNKSAVEIITSDD